MMPEAQQIAALPWRVRDGRLQILLVTTRETGRWVIPKGWPMPGKKAWEAAAIEAFEEAGVTGLIAQTPSGSFEYQKRRATSTDMLINVSVYALEVTGEAKRWPEMRERKRRWLAAGDAGASVGEQGLKQIIAEFAKARGVAFAEPKLKWFHWFRRLFR